MGLVLGKPQPLETLIPKFRAYHFILISLWVMLAIPIVIMTSQMSNIGALHSFAGYFEPFDTVNSTQVPSESSKTQWQTCLFQPNYLYTTKPNVNLIIASYNAQAAEINAIINSKGIAALEQFLLPSQAEKSGSFMAEGGPFIESLMYVGLLVLGMTLMGQTAVFLAWKHEGWLFSAGCFGVFCSLLSCSYYNSDPPIPVPTKTNATLLLFLGWLSKPNFDNINGGDNNCGPAYYYVAFYLAMLCLMILIMGAGTSMAFFADYCRLKFSETKPPKASPRLLSLLNVLLALIVCCALMFLSCFLGRVGTSFTSLACISGRNGPSVATAYASVQLQSKAPTLEPTRNPIGPPPQTAAPTTPTLLPTPRIVKPTPAPVVEPTGRPIGLPTPTTAAPTPTAAVVAAAFALPDNPNRNIAPRARTAATSTTQSRTNTHIHAAATITTSTSANVKGKDKARDEWRVDVSAEQRRLVDATGSNATADEDFIAYPPIFFPFKPFVINPYSPLWATVFVTSARAWMHNRVSPLRITTVASLGYVIFSIPAQIANLNIYNILDFADATTCQNTYLNPFFIYPSLVQATAYCNWTNFTSWADFVLMLLMFFVCLVSGYIVVTYYRSSGASEKAEYTFDEKNGDVFNKVFRTSSVTIDGRTALPLPMEGGARGSLNAEVSDDKRPPSRSSASELKQSLVTDEL